MKKTNLIKVLSFVLLATLFFAGCSNAVLLNEDLVVDNAAKTVIPEGPANLRIHLKRPTTVGLIWDTDTNAVSYKISGDNKVATQSHNFYYFNDLTYGETYTFNVTSIDANGIESSPSEITVTMDSTLSTPTGVVATKVTATTIEVTWDLTNEEIHSYGVYVSGDKGMLIGATTNSCLIEGLTEGGEYSIRVESCGYNKDRSDLSEAIYVTTVAPYPQWDAETAYETGDRVTYNGDVYEAKWWSYAEIPGSIEIGGSWTLIQ